MRYPKKRAFRKGFKTSIEAITESGYILGSHIRKGLYEPVSAEQSALMRGAYDDASSKYNDVDPLASYKYDKFELALMNGKKVTPNPAPQEPVQE